MLQFQMALLMKALLKKIAMQTVIKFLLVFSVKFCINIKYENKRNSITKVTIYKIKIKTDTSLLTYN